MLKDDGDLAGAPDVGRFARPTIGDESNRPVAAALGRGRHKDCTARRHGQGYRQAARKWRVRASGSLSIVLQDRPARLGVETIRPAGLGVVNGVRYVCLVVHTRAG